MAVLKSRKNTGKKSKWARTYMHNNRIQLSHFFGIRKQQKINSKIPVLKSLRRTEFNLISYFKQTH